jgi:hypothetical protein
MASRGWAPPPNDVFSRAVYGFRPIVVEVHSRRFVALRLHGFRLREGAVYSTTPDSKVKERGMTHMTCGHSVGMLVAAVVAACAAVPASAQVKSWSGGTIQWGTATNWSPVGVPGIANPVLIGNLPAVENDAVSLNINATISSLTITDGMGLLSQNSQLLVTGATLLSGQNELPNGVTSSRIHVMDGPAASDVVLSSLTLEDGADLYMNGGTLVLSGLLDLGPSTYTAGDGLIRLTSNAAVAMRVDGTFFAGSPILTISQEGSGRIDLDGTVAGDHVLHIDGTTQDGTDFTRLTLIGEGLVDTMDDSLRIGPGNELTMTLDEGWTLGAGAAVTIVIGESDLPSYLKGSHVTWRGSLSLVNQGVKAQIEAPQTFESTATATLATGALLTCMNDVTLVGGDFVLNEDANINFDGDTAVHDPVFETHSELSSDGTVDFNGPTSFDGTLTVDGNARQNGDATVVGPTVIDALRFDLDGASGTTSWSIGNALVLNIGDHLDSGNDIFDGSINVSGTFLGKLTVNLPGANSAWVMDGSMVLGGVGAILTTRVAGSDMVVTGELDITNRVRLDCETSFGPGANIGFASLSARLRLAKDSSMAADTVFVGGGTLENESGASLELDAGINLFTSHLWNAGTLSIGDGPGLVNVSSATLEPSSTLRVAIGGPANGDWDRIGAGNPCTIGGTLDIRLVDLGGGIYEPAVGQSFTILQASGANSVSGTFATVLPSYAPGEVYHWGVSVTSTQSTIVTVKVASIVPCPGELTGDGVVDAADLAVLLGSWGPCRGCDADFDGDGAVGGPDLAMLLGAWGNCS